MALLDRMNSAWTEYEAWKLNNKGVTALIRSWYRSHSVNARNKVLSLHKCFLFCCGCIEKRQGTFSIQLH